MGPNAGSSPAYNEFAICKHIQNLYIVQAPCGSAEAMKSKSVFTYVYVVPSVMAAQLSVKQLGRVRFPGSTQPCSYSLMEEHCLGMTDIVVRFYVRAPKLSPFSYNGITPVL